MLSQSTLVKQYFKNFFNESLGNKLCKNVVGQGITWVFSALVITPLSAINFFCHNCSLCCLLFTSAALDFILEANSMNSDLGQYCLQYRVPQKQVFESADDKGGNWEEKC